MGNRKFKFSEMIPNAWFYKLKEMGSSRNHQQQSRRKKTPSPPPPQEPPQKEPHREVSASHTRKSYYFTRDMKPIDPPRKSTKKTRPTTTKKRTTFTPTPTSTIKSSSSSSSSAAGEDACVVIDVDSKSLGRKTEDSVSTLQLPPIRTERKKFNDSVKQIGGTDEESFDFPIKQTKKSVKIESFSAKVPTEEEESVASSVLKEQGIRPSRRFPAGSPRFRIRVNSPRIARRAQVNTNKGNISRKSMSSESLAVVKSSCDPRRDFRDSMVEMIVENNIKASKDLEELLACYLSLNSDEYHDVIIQVFKQIWFDLNKIRGVEYL
ncbi:hypothetical protein V2J09_007037 [Rumex salicifolius]